LRDFLNLKISFAVILTFVISLSFLYFINDWYFTQTNLEEEKFYAKQIDNVEKQIFLVGSSHTIRLDPNLIQKFLQKHGFDYDVYNIAKTGDKPSNRVNSIERIISAKPEIIVYGLDIVSFRSDPNERIITPQNSFIKNIDIQNNLNHLFFEIINDSKSIDLMNFKNPKLTSLKIIMDITKNDDSVNYSPNQPFSKNDIFTLIMNTPQLENNVKEKPFSEKGRFVDHDGIDFFTMKKILKNFKESNIQIILFITPHHEIYLNDMSDKDKNTFFAIIEDLKNEFNIKVYDLHDKYSDKNIWWDATHIARNAPGGLIYSEDIAKIVLEEIKNIAV